jgi:ubiquinone biosynthesis accessory factor UbiJ
MLLDRLETALNRNIAESRKAKLLARQLDGKVMSLVASGTPLALYFRVHEGRFALGTRAEGEADASLSGTPLSLLALAGPQAESNLRGGSVRIEGDAEVAQKFRDLLKLSRPEFEEELSRVIGDVAAHRAANVARGFLDWGRKASGSFATSVAEYLQEEGRDVPARVEIEEFLEGVDELRESADRFEARLARLEAQRR